MLTQRAGPFGARCTYERCVAVVNITTTGWNGEWVGRISRSGGSYQTAVTSNIATHHRAALAVVHEAAGGTGLATCHTCM